jgi:methylmalonyl-CoA decarboxylase
LNVSVTSEPGRFIRTEVKNNVGTIALDNYAKRNALSQTLLEQVLAALNAFNDQHVRCVVIRSAVDGKVWCSGHDIEELPKADIDPLPFNEPMVRLFRAISNHPTPVIAMVRGQVWGGGCGLIMACDLVYGDETSAFAITPAKLGLPYNATGFLTFMNRLPLSIVKEMFFTAELIGAERAERFGIVNEIVPVGDLEAHTYRVAEIICSRSAQAIRAFKEALRILSDAVAINPTTYEYLHGLRRDVYFGADYHEGIEAFLQKRPPHF